MKPEALVGWSAITALVVAYDTWAVRGEHQTLSSGFWHAARGKWSRWFLWPAWTLLSVHLFFGWPP